MLISQLTFASSNIFFTRYRGVLNLIKQVAGLMPCALGTVILLTAII